MKKLGWFWVKAGIDKKETGKQHNSSKLDGQQVFFVLGVFIHFLELFIHLFLEERSPAAVIAVRRLVDPNNSEPDDLTNEGMF